MSNDTVYYTYTPTPHGTILIAGTEMGLYAVNFQDGAHPMPLGNEWQKDASMLRDASDQLQAYFDGDLTEFDVRLNPVSTDFQRRVWDELCTIPYGETVSYATIAERLDQPTATRAVASANAQNPIAILIPCHRVIGSDGALRGYAGGIEIKAELLALEQRKSPAQGHQLYL